VDLNQVTVKKLDAALGSSPAALLSGNNEIERAFVLERQRHPRRSGVAGSNRQSRPIPVSKKLQWRLMNRATGVMELRDTFGLKTELRFSKMQRNPQLSPSLFKFVPPKGADVLGE